MVLSMCGTFKACSGTWKMTSIKLAKLLQQSYPANVLPMQSRGSGIELSLQFHKSELARNLRKILHAPDTVKATRSSVAESS